MAWSLAETRMRILCLEQGDWIRPTDFPTNGRDWEARRYTDFDIFPNHRGRATPTTRSTTTIRRSRSPISMASAAARLFSPRITRACIPRTSASGPSTASPMTGRSTTGRWSPTSPRTTGSAVSRVSPATPLILCTSRRCRRRRSEKPARGTRGRPTNSAGELVGRPIIAVATTDYNGRAKCINLGHCTPGCAQGAKASTDITYWPKAIRNRVELRTRCRVREIVTNESGWSPASSITTTREPSGSSGRRS